jgi:hypothetical protein
LAKPIKAKAGTGPGSFVEEVRRQTVDFYRDLVQGLKPPPLNTPKLREAEEPMLQHSPPPAGVEATEGEVRREHGLGLQNLAGLLSEVNP